MDGDGRTEVVKRVERPYDLSVERPYDLSVGDRRSRSTARTGTARRRTRSVPGTPSAGTP